MKSLSLFLAVLAVLLLISVPVSAQIKVTGGNIDVSKTIRPGYPTAFSYTCDPDEKISIIQYDIPINTVVDFTLNYGTSSSVSGQMIYRPAGVIGQSYSEVSIGGNTYSETFIDAQVAGYALTRHIQFVSYARNTSATSAKQTFFINDLNIMQANAIDPLSAQTQTGFAVYAQGYGLFSDEIAFFPVANLPSNMIYGVTISATQGTGITVVTNKADKLAEFVELTVAEAGGVDAILKKVNEFIVFLSAVTGIILTILWWLKFIFIDNIVITFLFYFLGTMAWDVNTAKSEFSFFAKFFRHQKMFLEFLISIVDRAWRWITRT